ncbi:MAG: YitT family protein [Lachnospiraceae bacterium]|nr:YitT family protein [Lachnospiraceae bacterium]
MKGKIKKFLLITCGTLFFGMALSLFIDPNDFAPGGASGLAIILNRVIPLETGTLFLLINIPIMILGVWQFGWKFILATLYATLMSSVFTNLFKSLPPLTTEPILAAVFGGALLALGMGMVLRNGATTGGSDIIVKCLRRKKPYLKTGTLLLLVDAVVIGIGGIVFRNVESMLYSVLSVAVTSAVLDMVLYGRDEAKLIYIVSDYFEEIAKRILGEVDIGVTYLSGTGGYERKEKQVILCVVKKPMAHKVEEIVKQEDAAAFMIISSASEIYGEGYKSYFGEKL